jgi:voltage-dependent anion channel protein 2
MATKFADIAKAPKTILVDDYSTKINLKCKKDAGDVAVTIETDRSSGGALASKIGLKGSYGKLNIDKAQATADGGHVLETSLSPCEGVVLSFKGNNGADLGVDYTKGHFVGTAALDVKDLSKITASSCYGLDSGFNIGGDATYALSGKTGISEFNLGASYTKGPTFASITTAAKVSQFNLGMVYKVNSDLSLASQTTHSSEKPFDLLAVGGIYKAPFADIKAKVSGDGVISACVMKEIVPKVTVTATGSVTATDMSNFKYGLGVSM